MTGLTIFFNNPALDVCLMAYSLYYTPVYSPAMSRDTGWYAAGIRKQKVGIRIKECLGAQEHKGLESKCHT